MPRPGQESVWDYLRLPRVEPTSKRIRVIFGGKVIVESNRAKRRLETNPLPFYYRASDFAGLFKYGPGTQGW